MIHPDTALRYISPEIGFGVFATAPIPRGTVLWTLCRFDIVLTPATLRTLPPAYLATVETYAYGDTDGNRILCWDNARNVNHSCAPAMRGLGNAIEIAVRDIAVGEEITCEYGGLNLPYRLDCKCGAPTCRGTIGGDDVLTLWQRWDDEVAAALPDAAHVPQPLLAFARDPQRFWDWVHGKLPAPSHRDYHARDEGVA